MIRPTAADPPLRLITLGELRLLGPAGEVLPGRTKLLVLLASLARRGPRPVTREELAALLWGGKEESRARQSLRNALVELRRAVGDGLEVTARTVRLAPEALEVDATLFERDIEQNRLEEAAARWGGAFLDGADGGVGEDCRAWIERERQLLRSLLAHALERLVDDAVARGRADAAVAWSERWSAALPFDERAQVRLVQALAREGRAAEAVSRHGAFVMRMREELGLEPSAELLRVGEEIRCRSLGDSLAASGSAAPDTPALCGSEAALAALTAAWRAVQDGAAAAVLVEGEEGVGKTRLCAEFLRRLEKPVFVLEGEGDDTDPTAWATARRVLAGLRHAPGLAGAADAALGELSALVPSLRERYPCLPGPAGSDAALASALRDVLRDVATEVPVVLMIDDVARADAGTQQLLASLLVNQPPSLLVLLAARTDELAHSPLPGVLRRTPTFRQLRLQPLGRTYPLQRAGASVSRSRGARKARRGKAAAIAGLLLTGSVGVALWNPGTSLAGAETERRVVVGSFTNETGDPALDLIGPITSDWLVQGIARTGAVQVVPLSNDGSAQTSQRAGTQELGRLLDLAKDAQADVLIRGAYHISGDSVLLRAQIIDVHRGELLQAVDPVGAPAASPMVGIEILRERTIGSLAPWVDPRMAASARRQSSPPSYESYRLFAQGLEHSYRRDMQSIDYFLRAFALDTSYAAPLLHVISEYRSTGQYAAADSTTRRLSPRRSELTPFERSMLDWHRAWLDGDLSRQYAAVGAAAEIAPGSRMAALHLPGLAIALNRPHRAVELFSRVDAESAEAQSSSYWVWFAGALHMTGEFDRQLEIGRLVQQRFPQDPRGLSHQARALAALGRLRELDAVLAQSLALPVPDGWEPTGMSIHLAAADELADQGHAAASRRVIERVLQFHEDVSPDIHERVRYQFVLGQALFRAGRLNEARRVFERLLTRDTLQNELRVAIRAHVGYIAAQQGDVQTARDIDTWLRDPGLPYLFGQNTEARAIIAALLGDRELAVRLLRQASGEGRPYDSSTRGRFEFSSLRGYVPFEQWARPRG